MAYTPQQWHDDDTSAPYGPINGTRLNYIEAGIEAAAAVADAAGGGGAAIGTATPLIDGSATAGTASTASAVDHVHPTDSSRSALASPTFTGTPAAPTAAVDTSTAQLATTAYVVGQGYAKLASPTFTGTVVLPTGTISTGMILDGTIVDGDISSSAAVAVAKLAPGTAAQVLTTTGGTAVWATPSGGGALTTVTNTLGTDIPMGTAGTYYDGPAVTCAAGTWLLMGKVHVLAGSTAIRTFTAKLWDGTAAYAINTEAITGTGTVGNVGLPVSMLVTPATSTQYKISVTSTVNAETLKGTSVSLLSYLQGIKVG